MTAQTPFRVLVVDDSKAMCAFLVDALSAHPRLEVVGYALNAFEAGAMLRRTKPDVMTLDVEMPHMDGVTFLRKIMQTSPIPVVMLSSQTTAGATATLNALEAGAVDFLPKRQAGSSEDVATYTRQIARRVVNAAQIRLRTESTGQQNRSAGADVLKVAHLLKGRLAHGSFEPCLVGIGASTGGPEALRKLLTDFHSSSSAVFISQHMPESFMKPFADRLNQTSRFTIAIAEDGELVEAGRVYVAPGDLHLQIVRKPSGLHCHAVKQELVNGHRPSVDVMFDSLNEAARGAALGILLTGMGDDGARGLKRLQQSGVPTIAQDEQSSAVWGMPGSACKQGAADHVLAIDELAPVLNAALGENTSRRIA